MGNWFVSMFGTWYGKQTMFFSVCIQSHVRTCEPLLDLFPKPVKHKHCSAAGSKDVIGHVTHIADCLHNGEGGLCSTKVGFSKLMGFFYTIECYYIM